MIDLNSAPLNLAIDFGIVVKLPFSGYISFFLQKADKNIIVLLLAKVNKKTHKIMGSPRFKNILLYNTNPTS